MLIRSLWIALIVLGAQVVNPAHLAAQQVQVTTLDGKQSFGELVAWNPEQIEVRIGSEVVNYPIANLFGMRFGEIRSRPPKFFPSVRFADGSRLPIAKFVVNNRQATITTPLASEPLKVPVSQIDHVQFLRSSEEFDGSREVTGDYLVVTKKNSDVTETLSGVINDVTDEQVEFTWEGDIVPVKRTKIAALGYFHADNSEPATPVCTLSLESGAELPVSRVEVDGDQFRVVTVGGIELSFASADLQNADFSAGKLAYLSDMKPVRSEWTPLVGLPVNLESIREFGAPRVNSSFSGSALKLSWPSEEARTYEKGLAIRSRTELEYRLPKSMRRFLATAGIDPETLEQGSVQLTLEVDGNVVFEQEIDGKQPPVNFDIDVEGKQRLRIVVDYGQNLDLGDRLHLVEARLVK